MRKVLLDIIGCGSVVQTTHSKILNTVKSLGIEPLGCYDINPGLADSVSTQLSCRQYKDEDELFRSAADAVLIATPPSSHFALVSRALNQGKWVLCEKPFVTSKHEAERLISLAASKDLGILVGHFRRAFPSLQIAREFLTDRISDIESVEAFEGARFDWPTESGYVSADKYGNVIYDTGSHLIDMVLYALSLDRGPYDFVIEGIRHEPSVGPCHEAAFSLQLSPPGANIPVKIRLSRYRPERNVIRFKMRKEELILRTSFRMSPRLKVGSRYFDLTSKDRGAFAPAGVYDCFALEYVLLQSSIVRSLPAENIFDAASFVTLTAILERATEERVLTHAAGGKD